MPAINAALLQKIQKKLGVTQGRAYAAIADKANALVLPRHLAAIALAAELGININKVGYATDEERHHIRSAVNSGRSNSSAAPQPAAAPPTRERAKKNGSRRPPRPQKSNTVMVVHGRDMAIRDSMFAFLRALGLHPLEFSQGVKATRKGSPDVREVIDALLLKAEAVVVVLTPDDEARLKPRLRKASDAPFERTLTGQARPNVLFEAGRAFGSHPNNTILVMVGAHRPMSDLAGVHFVRFDGGSEGRNELATRLETARCEVQKIGNDWLTVGDFKVRGN